MTATTIGEDRLAELAGGLRTVVNRLGHVFRGPGARRGVTPTRLTAMVILERIGPMRAGDLADRLHITAASMSRLAEALEEGDWLRRTQDPDDGRAWLLSLSDHGREMLEELRRESTSELAADLRALPAEKQELLCAALPVLVELADRRLEVARQR